MKEFSFMEPYDKQFVTVNSSSEETKIFFYIPEYPLAYSYLYHFLLFNCTSLSKFYLADLDLHSLII